MKNAPDRKIRGIFYAGEETHSDSAPSAWILADHKKRPGSRDQGRFF
jgi:hypothetical protein